MTRIERGPLDAGAADAAARALPVDTGMTLDTFQRKAEAAYLEELMTEFGGRKKQVAARAGISYNRLLRRLAVHQIEPRYVSRRR